MNLLSNNYKIHIHNDICVYVHICLYINDAYDYMVYYMYYDAYDLENTYYIYIYR